MCTDKENILRWNFKLIHRYLTYIETHQTALLWGMLVDKLLEQGS